MNSSKHTVVNFESVITKQSISPYEKSKNWLHFDRPEKIMKVLSDYNLKNLSLANNHSVDFGVKGLEETFKVLRKNKINFFGAGNNEIEASKPIMIKDGKQEVLIYAAFEYRKSYAKKYNAYAGEKSIDVQSLKSEVFFKNISRFKQTHPKALHIAFVHWGKNYRFKTSQAQEKLAKKLLKAGIDVIIGHGAHTIQKIDQLDGKWVFYNIGNSIFPSPGRYKKNKAHPYSLMVNFDKNHFKIYPILTDNKLTQYQSRFVNEEQFKEIKSLLMPTLKNQKTEKDKHGYYFKLNLEEKNS